MIVDTEDLMTASEIARLAGVSPSAVSNWQKRDLGFPMPVVEKAGTGTACSFRLWLRQEVEPWVSERIANREASRAKALDYHREQVEKLARELER